MRITRARVVLLVVSAAAVAAIVFATRPRPLEVDTGLVTRGPLESTIDADGRARVRQRYVIVAPVTGRVERLTLREGALVRAGNVVARIKPAPLDAQASAQAQARVDAATALSLDAASQVRVADDALLQRKRDLSRARRLGEAGGVSPRYVEEAELAARAATEQSQSAAQRAQAAEASVREARAVLSGRTDSGADVAVRAPSTGRVLRVPEVSERIVVAGTPILEVGDPGALEFVIDVLSSDATLIEQGDLVRLDHFTGDENGELTGRVRLIEPTAFTKVSALGVEEQRVNVIVDVPDYPDGVGDGFRIEARIVVWSSPNALSVPVSALLRPTATAADATWGVFVVREHRIDRRAVRVGHLAGDRAEVLSGLVAGDEVIVFPPDNMKPGMRATSRQR